MALPKLDVQTYELTLPSTGEKLKYRPFLVKEQKILLMANEGKDPNEMVEAIRQILVNCLITEVSVEDLPLFDIEYLFLQLRAKSVGEISKLHFPCDNKKTENGEECKEVIDININLSKIPVYKDPSHTTKIKLNDELGLIMKYPKIELLNEIEQLSMNDLDGVIGIVLQCIDNIFDSENVYNPKDHTKEELESFLYDMTQDQFEKIQHFFETMPKLKETVVYKCEKCKKETSIELEGLQSFF